MRPRFISIAWLASLFFLISPVSQANDPELDALLLESSNLMQDGRIEEALTLLEGAEGQYAGNYEYMNNLAVAYLGDGQAEKALVIFRELVDNDPLFSIIAHNLLEMELQISETRPENISPVLFVQSVESYELTEAGSSSSGNSTQTIPGNIIADIQNLVENWASHWSNKNLIEYLSMYSRNFVGPEGEDFSQWARARRDPLTKAGSISVRTSNFDINAINNNEVRVSFDQAYNSSNYSDRVRKQLVFRLEDQDWKIIREVTLETY
jgi:hypothetical protein